jgi:hypothetical protein
MLGGLISQYVVGLMYHRRMFKTIQPVNFATFASPHLGTRRINSGFLNSIMNLLASILLGSSGRQMFIADRGREPLLLRMAKKGNFPPQCVTDPDSIFIRGLAMFKTRTAYANIINDRSVPYHSAAISQDDPFLDLTQLNISYLPDYSSVIVHPTQPIIPHPKATEPTHPVTARRFLFPFGIALLLPLWATFVFLASLYQNFFSARRIAYHLSLQNGSEVEQTTLNGDVPEVLDVDVVVNEILSETTEEQEEFGENADDVTPLLEGMNGKGAKPVIFQTQQHRLPLTKVELLILAGLRSVDWQIFGVHIHKTVHSHAAIIRRSKWSDELAEGKYVIRHWLRTQFKL